MLCAFRQKTREKRAQDRDVNSLGKYFLSLMEGCSHTAWYSLLCFKQFVANMVFGYDPVSQTLKPPPESTSWVLHWVLCFYSPKHRFCNGKPPNMKTLSKDTWNAMQKLLWRLHLQHSGASLPLVKSCSTSVSSCSFMAGSCAHRWFMHFRRVFLDDVFCSFPS